MVLQKLEEQTERLEELLFMAEQEREQLRAAFAQEVSGNKPELPEQDQEVTGSKAQVGLLTVSGVCKKHRLMINNG